MKKGNILRDFEIYMMKKSIKEENEKRLVSLPEYHFEKYAESGDFAEFAMFTLVQMSFKKGCAFVTGDVWE